MFQFPSFATHRLCIQQWATWTLLHVGFPIRTLADQCLLTTPRNFSQFCHVLRRLLVPRHPPNALISLTTINRCCLEQGKGYGVWELRRWGPSSFVTYVEYVPRWGFPLPCSHTSSRLPTRTCRFCLFVRCFGKRFLFFLLQDAPANGQVVRV
jgi:hypothetical protein